MTRKPNKQATRSKQQTDIAARHGAGEHMVGRAHDEHAHHILPLKVYFGIFVALLVLLVATVGVSYLPLGPFAVPVAVLIAVVKMVLIILFFMHVKYSRRLIWIASSAAFLWLLIMFTLTFSDYISRSWLDTAAK